MDNKKTDQGQGKVQEAVKEVEQNSNGAGSGVTGKKFSIRNGQVVDDKGEIVGDLSEGKEVKEEEQQANGEQNEENGEKKKEGEENVNGENKVSDEVPESVEETIDETQAQIPDLSILKDKTVNKAGNIVDENGTVFGKLTEGQDNLKNLIGKSVDEEGKIWNAKGQVLARVEPVPENERQYPDHAPFEAFPDATVEKTGNVVFNGTIIGKVVEGDARKLAGKKVDADGEIVDNLGNVLGRADRWEEEEPEVEEEEKPDLSALAGKRVNKVGNVVDQSGALYGRLVEGDPKKLSGKMCDKDGNVWNDGGQVVGRAELVPDSEREGEKEGIFAGFEGLTVNKEGKIVDAKGAIVGRLSSGDAKQLYGKQVDEDGDILDKNGNVLGKAERWEEEEEPEKEANPLAGLKINREGNVVDSNGEIIGKLTEGTLTKCVGQEIDNDGDIVNSKGHSIGHATLLSNIPPEPEPEEPGETEEEAEKRKQAESDKKLAGQMAGCIEQSIDKIKPVLKMITEVSNIPSTIILTMNCQLTPRSNLGNRSSRASTERRTRRTETR